MNLDRIQGVLRQFKGSAKQHWGKLIDDQFIVMEGKRDYRAGVVQESFSIIKDETRKQIAGL